MKEIMLLGCRMVRFEVGQRVRIDNVIFTKYCGQSGVIRAAMLNKKGKMTLDKYNVEFSDGTESVFWSIQLKPDGLQSATGEW